MNHSKQLLTVLCCFVAFSIFTANYIFAQGQGQGQGQGLLNNTGCENGKGFTTGQGHLNGKSAVECGGEDPCIDNVIDAAIYTINHGGRGTVLDSNITGANTFDLVVDTASGCFIYHFSWTGDPCGTFDFSRDSISPCR